MEQYFKIRKYAVDAKTHTVAEEYTEKLMKFKSKQEADAYCSKMTKVDALYIAKEIEVEIIRKPKAEVKEDTTTSL